MINSAKGQLTIPQIGPAFYVISKPLGVSPVFFSPHSKHLSSRISRCGW